MTDHRITYKSTILSVKDEKFDEQLNDFAGGDLVEFIVFGDKVRILAMDVDQEQQVLLEDLDDEQLDELFEETEHHQVEPK